MKTGYAIGLIDVQRGFMPEEEGERLSLPGFGELPVPESEQIIYPLNMLLQSDVINKAQVFTTQDWHPENTAHFSNEPNFKIDWPRHCVAYTPGAALHPELFIPKFTSHFFKGEEELLYGADDTSYSAFNSRNTAGESLPDWLTREQIHTVGLGGIALEYCLGLSAVDLRHQLGLRVLLLEDTTRPVSKPDGVEMLERLEKMGVEIVTSRDLINELENL